MIEQEYSINAPIEQVWEALVDPMIVEKWSGSPATMSAIEGGEFSLWGGDIWGSNTKVIDQQLLEQDWYGGDWSAPSKVAISLTEDNGGTKLTLEHDGVPGVEEDSFDEGWSDYYFGPIKDMMESDE